MRNIYTDLMIKMLAGNKKKSIYFFQISAVCIGVCAPYVHHARYIPGSRDS